VLLSRSRSWPRLPEALIRRSGVFLNWALSLSEYRLVLCKHGPKTAIRSEPEIREVRFRDAGQPARHPAPPTAQPIGRLRRPSSPRHQGLHRPVRISTQALIFPSAIDRWQTGRSPQTDPLSSCHSDVSPWASNRGSRSIGGGHADLGKVATVSRSKSGVTIPDAPDGNAGRSIGDGPAGVK